MKPSHIDALVKCANSLESTAIDFDAFTPSQLVDRLWRLHEQLTTVVGAIQLDRDEMSGVLE